MVYETLDAVEKVGDRRGHADREAVREHYMNYNLQVVASQEMLNKLLGAQQSTTGSRYGLYFWEPNVSGTEWTTTDITVDLRPGNRAADLDLILNGVTQSQHRRRDQPGEHLHVGLHRWGAKKTDSDSMGKTVVTGPAEMTYRSPSKHHDRRFDAVQPECLSSGESTIIRLSSKANMRRGESEAIAGPAIESRVLPDFDTRRRSDDPRVRPPAKVRTCESGWRVAGVLPTTCPAPRSNTVLPAVLSAEIASPDELARRHRQTRLASRGPPGHLSPRELAEQRHQPDEVRRQTMTGTPRSLPNCSDTCRCWRGRRSTSPPRQRNSPLHKPACPGLPRRPNRSRRLTSKKIANFVFDQEDPIRFTIDDGQIKLVIRAGFQAGGTAGRAHAGDYGSPATGRGWRPNGN